MFFDKLWYAAVVIKFNIYAGHVSKQKDKTKQKTKTWCLILHWAIFCSTEMFGIKAVQTWLWNCITLYWIPNAVNSDGGILTGVHELKLDSSCFWCVRKRVCAQEARKLLCPHNLAVDKQKWISRFEQRSGNKQCGHEWGKKEKKGGI